MRNVLKYVAAFLLGVFGVSGVEESEAVRRYELYMKEIEDKKADSTIILKRRPLNMLNNSLNEENAIDMAHRSHSSHSSHRSHYSGSGGHSSHASHTSHYSGTGGSYTPSTPSRSTPSRSTPSRSTPSRSTPSRSTPSRSTPSYYTYSGTEENSVTTYYTVQTDQMDILTAQKILNLMGYECGKEDGIKGKATIAAIKKFQEDFLLPDEWKGRYEPSGNIELDGKNIMEEFNMSEVQEKLNSLGYICPVKGLRDEETVKAIKVFQAEKGLTQNGILNKETLQALDITLGADDESK